MSKRYLSITDIYIKAIGESSDKNWEDTPVEDIKEAINYEKYLNDVFDKEDIGLVDLKSPSSIIGAIDVLSTALGYAKGKNDSVIESFLGDNPELFKYILSYIRKELKTTTNEDKKMMWSLGLKAFVENFYNEPEVNETEGVAVTDEEELWDVYETSFLILKDLTKEELLEAISGEVPVTEPSMATIDKEWDALQEYKAKRLKDPRYRTPEFCYDCEHADQKGYVDETTTPDEDYQKKAKADLVNLIDGEYEAIKDYSKEDLFDYIAAIWPKISKTVVDEVWEQYFG